MGSMAGDIFVTFSGRIGYVQDKRAAQRSIQAQPGGTEHRRLPGTEEAEQ